MYLMTWLLEMYNLHILSRLKFLSNGYNYIKNCLQTFVLSEQKNNCYFDTPSRFHFIITTFKYTLKLCHEI